MALATDAPLLADAVLLEDAPLFTVDRVCFAVVDDTEAVLLDWR